ncbi:MAG: aerobic carbon-monoxide dehydrogenase large subunit [Actinomycetota bacterium]|nr:aerobic carbon-monoxide dehydrogenase large subunit [Actinomycetota bacterium]
MLGRRQPRLEDGDILRGTARYVADLSLPGTAWVAYARATMAHARITVDVARARAMPGVIAVFTAADLGSPELPAPALPGNRYAVAGLGRPVLASDRVRFVGEPMAAVVAESPSLAADALEGIDVEYEPLPAVIGPDAAIAGDTLLFAAAGSNVIAACDLSTEVWDGFAGCDVVVSQRIVNHSLAAAPMEGRGCAVEWGEDGRVNVWVSTQMPHMVRMGFAAAARLTPDQVRMRSVAVGGAFGAKGFPYPEELLLPGLSRALRRPLKWVETRTESMQVMATGRGQTATITMGATRDGRVQAVEYDVVQDTGAYPGLGTFMPDVAWHVATGPYTIPQARLRGRSVVTNTTPVGAYRGAGRPEATMALERLLDLLAADLDLDPVEIRRRNLIPPDAYPYTACTGSVYDSGDVAGALDAVLAAVDYTALRAEQARLREAAGRMRLGIGLATFVDIAGRFAPPDFGGVEVTPAGRAVIRTGSSPHGQGHATVWAQIVAERTGIPLGDMDFVAGDTDEVPVGGGTFGSKSLQSAGVALQRAAATLVEAATPYAAKLLEAAEGDVVLDPDRGAFHVRGTPAMTVGWKDVARLAADTGVERLCGEAVVDDTRATFPSGAYLAVVTIDVETGGVRLVRMVTCDDAGRIMNPLIAEGQVHGGLVQGIAQALWEEVRHDEEGTLLTSTLADYLVPSACEVPSFEGMFQETATDRNPLGAKGIGESGTIGATPAVVNAVLDGLSEFGIRHLDTPLSPERVWRAIRLTTNLASSTVE